MEKRKAIIVGASGLIGSRLLDKLVNDSAYSEVVSIVRKASGKNHAKLRELCVDFKDLERYKSEIVGDVVFLCVGTTRKKSPDQSEYRSIDYGINLGVAQIAKENGAEEVHLISAIGADVNASIFYNTLKGEIERDLKAMDFPAMFIYQPSILIGARTESRPAEYISQKTVPFFDLFLRGKWSNYHSVKAEEVAQAMLNYSKKEVLGCFTLTYKDFFV